MRYIIVICILVSLFFWVLGVFFPMMTLGGSLEVPFLGEISLGEKTQSIWQSIVFLMETNYWIPALLIFIFSVIVPIFKNVALIYVLIVKPYPNKLYFFVNALSKWSMADILVVSIFIAYLSGSSIKGFYAYLQKGFYFFLIYCLMSIILSQVSVFALNTDKGKKV